MTKRMIAAGRVPSRRAVREAYERLYDVASHGGRPCPQDIKLAHENGAISDSELACITAMKNYPEIEN